jgi:Spy/CpxP family protein refolding chaperone
MHALHALNLSADQKRQIAGAMRANQQALRRQIDAVLTPDQRTQLRTALAHAHRAPGTGFGGPNPPAQ